MNDTYSCSYVEVLEVLKNISKEDYKKIPKEKIEFFEENKDKNYIFIYDKFNSKLSRKTQAILTSLYRDYIAKDTDKEKIDEILKLNEIKAEKEKQQKYNTKNIFDKPQETQKKETSKESQEETKNVQIIVKKENFFIKILNKIKNFFHNKSH